MGGNFSKYYAYDLVKAEYALIYFSKVMSITFEGIGGAGGFLSQPLSFSQSLKYCLS